jgi:hypothetical protein
MTRPLSWEERAALPAAPLGLPSIRPLTLRDVVWASAYAADFARQFADGWSAAPGVEWRHEEDASTVVPVDRTGPAVAGVNVERCKAVADAAVERMGE